MSMQACLHPKVTAIIAAIKFVSNNRRLGRGTLPRWLMVVTVANKQASSLRREFCQI